jgi:hypothetical protein
VVCIGGNLKNLIIITVLLVSQAAFAGKKVRITEEMRRNLQIGTITISEVSAPEEDERSDGRSAAMAPPPMAVSGSLEGINGAAAYLTAADVAVDKIISIGSKIYRVIEKGQAVINANFAAGNALPRGARHWTQLEFWKRSQVRHFVIDMKSLAGIQQVYARFRVTSLYGGSVGGIGQYIGYAQVEAEDVYAMWGFQLDARAQVVQVYNMGSAANPVAGVTMNLNVQIQNVLKQKQTSSIALYFDGNGRITSSADK